MLKDVVAVKLIENYKLHLTFEDEVEGIVDLAKILDFTGIFEPLRNFDYFAQVTVNPDLGTICWDNGADLDPVVLYAKIANREQSIEEIRDRLLPKLMSGEIRVKDAEQLLEEVM